MIRACLGKSIKRLAHKLRVPSSSTVPVMLGELQTGTFEGEATNPTCVSISPPYNCPSWPSGWSLTWDIVGFSLRRFSPSPAPPASFIWSNFIPHLQSHPQELEGAGTPRCLLTVLKESAHPTPGAVAFHQRDNAWEGQKGKKPSGSPVPVSRSLSDGFNHFHNIQRNWERILKRIAI